MIFSVCDDFVGTRETAEQNCFLLANGLGGYVSLNILGGTARGDHSMFMAALRAPNVRWNLITNIIENIEIDGSSYTISSQRMADGNDLCGHRFLKGFSYDTAYAPPTWTYELDGITVVRQITAVYGENTVMTRYRVSNPKARDITLTLSPLLRFTAKNDELLPDAPFSLKKTVCKNSDNGVFDEPKKQCNISSYIITGNGQTARFITDGDVTECNSVFGPMKWLQDTRDGRRDEGIGIINHTISKKSRSDNFDLTIIYTLGNSPFLSDGLFLSGISHNCGICNNGFEKHGAGSDTASSEKHDTRGGIRPSENLSEIFNAAVRAEKDRICAIIEHSGLKSGLGRQLAAAGDAYIVSRESTGGKTIIAGYPFFEDWGRDTMFSLGGTTIATGRFSDCRSILGTFAKYVKNGLLPNLFPEGGHTPMYNSVDAPLLFVNAVYEYIKLSGDTEFLKECFEPMKNIMDAYERGTDFNIRCESDGLISAGDGLWQLTWMDVCVDGFLPTPRHGKPVEINAYWYSALRAMEEFCEIYGPMDILAEKYRHMAALTRKSFIEKFPCDETGGLKDVLSGTYEENQIRCNQIWALTMPFTMLDTALEDKILDTVYNELYTSAGLRTLTMSDENFHPVYIGDMRARDRAYHQGTVWTFPLGAYLRARIRHLSCYDGHKRAEQISLLKKAFTALEDWLHEGCLGHLAEIYDGGTPTVSRGCFAQAWSVGEILRAVYEWEHSDYYD